MFGEHKSALDDKGRMNMPAKLREELGDSFYVSKAINKKAKCLTIYTNEAWERLAEKLKTLPQTKTGDLRRFIFGSAEMIKPDKQGRMLIPKILRDYAGLDGEAVIIGMDDKAELWSREALDSNNNAISMFDLEDVAEEYGI